MHVYLDYSGGGGGGALATNHPPHPQYMLTYSYKETHLTRNNTQQHKRTRNNSQQHTTTVDNSTLIHKITNVPLFKKLWDIIFLVGQSLYEPFLGTFWGGRGQKSWGPLKMSLEVAHIVPPKKIISRSFFNSGTLIVNTASEWLGGGGGGCWVLLEIILYSAGHSVSFRTFKIARPPKTIT